MFVSSVIMKCVLAPEKFSIWYKFKNKCLQISWLGTEKQNSSAKDGAHIYLAHISPPDPNLKKKTYIYYRKCLKQNERKIQ